MRKRTLNAITKSVEADYADPFRAGRDSRIEYNADGEPLGERGSFEQHVASIHRRELARFTRRAFTYAGFVTLGIIIGRFVA